MPKYRVQYTVSLETFIECEPSELVDEVPNIFIPEDDENKYVEDTFEVDGIYLQKSNGQEVEVDDDGKTQEEDDLDLELEKSLAEVKEEDEDEKEEDYF